MAVFRNIIIFILIIGFTSFAVYSQEQAFFFSEHFNDLSNWKPIGVGRIFTKKEFNVYKFKKLRWKWKTEGIYNKGNAKTREGDDFPIRVYIMFKYGPQNASFWEKVIYNSAKLIYGEYPPHSSLNYIWANMLHEVIYNSAKLIYGEYPPHSSLNYIWANLLHEDTVITSRYTDRSKMILLQKGKENLGKWVVQDVNIRKKASSYRKHCHHERL